MEAILELAKEPTIAAIPFFVVSMVIEYLVIRKSGKAYPIPDAIASLSGGLGSLVVKYFFGVVVYTLMYGLYEQRLFNPGNGAAAWVVLILAEDFVYYWWHRLSHEVRILWAAHVVHHSSEQYHLATALRQSWTAPFTSVLFWAPLAWLGFHPLMIALQQSFSLLYQYWIHTETIGRLGPLEWIMNTPSHHRVHHGSNNQYLDRNHAGIFIIWDRLFGTFEPEGEKVHYGLTKNVDSNNWVYLQFHEFAGIISDVWKASGWRAKLRRVFASPESLARERGEL